jgi:pimeloyl-ACP methyl ester carboxylesterase
MPKLEIKTLFCAITLGCSLFIYQSVPAQSTVTPQAPPPLWSEVSGTIQLQIPSTFDGSLQHAIWNPAKSPTAPRPLLVALHSWSGDFKQSSGVDYLHEAKERDWHFIHPDFRGMNNRPAATCSDLVVSDILDSVTYAQSIAQVDPRRIYLVGASGGGMASLMLAAKAPDVWAAVSAWVPISDLRRWHHETGTRHLRYKDMIESSCGGAPGKNISVDFQYWNRSPITFMEKARAVHLDINTGIMDGHTGSVPVGHSLRAFNELAAPKNRFSEEHIRQMEENKTIPNVLRTAVEQDPSYGDKQPLLRRSSGKARITVFDGTHEIIVEAAMQWLESKQKE